MKYGYARTTHEHAEKIKQQTQILKENGAEIIYEDISRIRKGKERPVFNELTNKLKAGDTLIVSSLDRLSNSLVSIFEIISSLDDMGVIIISIKENIDTGTKQGRVFMESFKTLLLLDNTLITENVETGKLEAIKAGINMHRPRRWNDEQAIQILDYQVNNHYSIYELSKKFGFSTATIIRILRYARELKSHNK